ncbi:hypothetical protein F9K50_09060 [bacterium]|nr:MAG: hypothetical protein F9K50_09060 [bacterium]
MEMAEAKKITIQIPDDLLQRAMKSTGQGITPTIRRGLELLAASQAYEELRKLRGKYKFSIDIKELRKDRR